MNDSFFQSERLLGTGKSNGECQPKPSEEHGRLMQVQKKTEQGSSEADGSIGVPCRVFMQTQCGGKSAYIAKRCRWFSNDVLSLKVPAIVCNISSN